MPALHFYDTMSPVEKKGKSRVKKILTNLWHCPMDKVQKILYIMLLICNVFLYLGIFLPYIEVLGEKISLFQTIDGNSFLGVAIVCTVFLLLQKYWWTFLAGIVNLVLVLFESAGAEEQLAYASEQFQYCIAYRLQLIAAVVFVILILIRKIYDRRKRQKGE